MIVRIAAISLLWLGASPVLGDEAPVAGEARDRPAVIGTVRIDNGDIFDLTDPEEDKWFYRWINRLHVRTRQGTISNQLLFRPGDRFDKRTIEESERILRDNKYLYDASIESRPNDDGTVDLVVSTRDVWSLIPELSYSRNSGRSRSRIGLEETNLAGRGQQLRVLRDKGIERSEDEIHFSDRNLGRTWVSLAASYSDNSDGFSHALAVTRPFYALDARWAAGANVQVNDRRSQLYQFGEEAAEYRRERDYAHVFRGWSRGLQGDRAQRWTLGLVYDDSRYSVAADSTLPALVPPDRKLVYPYIGFELVEDDFATARNHDQIDRTEDFQMGLHVRASLGWADTAFGADRDALLFTAGVNRGFGSLQEDALFLAASTRGRLESGTLANATLSLSGSYYRRQSAKRVLYLAASGTVGDNLDFDGLVEIGGNAGLRGYPFRYQVGESRVLGTIEQRYYTDWHLWRIARIGAAVFADVGRVSGPNPLGADNRGWLADVGIGLRLALTRIAAGRVIHIDLAFPLESDPTIDEVQILIESRRSF